MSELKVNKLSPESGTTLTLGDAGDTIVNNGTASGFLPTAGSDGNILTSDGTNWASEAPAGGGMHTLLTTVNASNSASVEFTSSIDSTYSTYMIRFDEVVPVNDAQDFYLQFGTGSSPTWETSNYDYHNQRMSGSSSSEAHHQSTGQASIKMTNSGLGNTSTEPGWNGWMTIFNPASSTKKKMAQSLSMCYAYNAHVHAHWVGGVWETTTAVTAFKIYCDNGNFSGTFRLYGLA